MAQFPFVGPSYRARTKRANAERCINLYPEINNPTSKSVSSLYGTPGLRLWLTLAGGGIRGCLRFTTTISVVVAGSNVYRVDSDGTTTLLGVCSAGSTPVSMASNGTVVMLVTGPSGYAVNPVDKTLNQITDSAFTGADTVAFVDGYFVFNKTGTGQFQITGLYDTTVDALDFATAEGSPDLLKGLIADHREVWLMGENSTEVYFNSGNPDFPFERINGAYIEQGCAATYSIAKLADTVFWLSADDRGQGVVLRAQGYQPQRVSDHGVEYAISQMSRIDDAVAYTYQQEGHYFYVLNFPTANQTWVYDATTGLWHERAWRDPSNNVLKRHRSNCHMMFGGKNIVGDWENGNLYYMELDTQTDNGAVLPRIRIAPHLSDPDYRWQFFDALQIDMETGVGLSVAPGVDGNLPQAMLQWSDDGGDTWSNEFWTSMGKIGERRVRARWRRLGRSRDRVFKVTITDPVKVAIVGASCLVRVGTS